MFSNLQIHVCVCIQHPDELRNEVKGKTINEKDEKTFVRPSCVHHFLMDEAENKLNARKKNVLIISGQKWTSQTSSFAFKR